MSTFNPHRGSLSQAARRYAVPCLIGAVLLGSVGGRSNDSPDAKSSSPSGQPATGAVGSEGSAKPPWPAPTDVPARVKAAGLDLGPMGMAEHYHPQVQVSIGGQPVPVPANIGVDRATGAMSAVHTHTDDGTIHIEAATSGEVFTLGQLFIQWGVRLNSTHIGGVRAQRGGAVTLTSNGTPVPGDPANLRLEPDQVIVLSLP